MRHYITLNFLNYITYYIIHYFKCGFEEKDIGLLIDTVITLTIYPGYLSRNILTNKRGTLIFVGCLQPNWISYFAAWASACWHDVYSLLIAIQAYPVLVHTTKKVCPWQETSTRNQRYLISLSCLCSQHDTMIATLQFNAESKGEAR